MTTVDRVFLIVLDSVGCGALPDAAAYGDAGSNTLGHTAAAVGGLKLPHLAAMGLGNVIRLDGVPPAFTPRASWGRMAERSPGKDTTTGHWELAGLILDRPFPVYPEGFPPEVIGEFERLIGRRTLGNRPASGTVIIQELGEEHLRTGYPIVYTSADSVFQVAAHEDVIPVDELYRICRIAREILQGEHAVGRVIARPFTGAPGNFRRTERRHDFSLPPTGPTVLDALSKAGVPVTAVGKIYDIFAGRGISRAIHTADNDEGLRAITGAAADVARGLIFANLVDFDMLYGHRNDPRGYAAALEAFDAALPGITVLLRPGDLLIITADHGCDPTTASTDHSREYVPLLVFNPTRPAGRALGTRETFADVAATIAAAFGLRWPTGESFLKSVVRREKGES
ncbi:MAG: phosphopentomutase [Thermoanaerobacterales bacterium]|nr:phosphopentomutase [Thermoanaerobacterales bacterium]